MQTTYNSREFTAVQEASVLAALRPNQDGLSWFHNYTPSTDIAIPPGIHFVPAFFNGAAVTAPNLAAAAAYPSRLILTFNEPDNNPPGGSAMTVATALSLWHQFELTGCRLAAPATLNQTNGTWITQFMAGPVPETGLPPRVDYMPLHIYVSPALTLTQMVSAVLNYAAAVWAAWKLPILVTEVNIISFTGATPDLWTYGSQAQAIALFSALRSSCSFPQYHIERLCPYPLTIDATIAAMAPNYLNLILANLSDASLTPVGNAYRDAHV